MNKDLQTLLQSNLDKLNSMLSNGIAMQSDVNVVRAEKLKAEQEAKRKAEEEKRKAEEEAKRIAEAEIAAECVIESGILIKYTGNRKKVMIPQVVTEIGEEAFRKDLFENNLVESIELPR